MKMPAEVARLVERFTERRAEYESPSYLEARVRVDFLNPLFSALGWDIANAQGLPEFDRDVITEGRIQTSEGFKAPDYIFRTSGTPSFIVEAKKPSINLRDDPLPALQLRRYGWNAKIGVGVLTDFQEFAVYDCTIPPTSGDKSNTAQVDYYTFDAFEQYWPEIVERFARDSVCAGSLQQYAQSFAATRGSLAVDKVFLAELDEWRKNLASALAAHNDLDMDSLNYATHLIINRIVFLRICEDRRIEPYGTLRDDAKSAGGVYERLRVTFERADQKFNSGLFHFRLERGRNDPDTLTPRLNVPDGVLSKFIRRLYWPYGPYDFAVFPADVLGQVYEQFLGRTIALQGDNTAVVEEKPEVRKAGGVYYTPSHIVRDIVASTLGPKLEGKTPASLAKQNLSICDPACGSGTFLIEVYQFLLDWHRAYYMANSPVKWSRTRPPRLQTDVLGDWRLTTGERKRILTSHVYGVDIDPQAVEVTKLSLLLKVLEGETESSISQQFELFQERVLPDLDSSVKCGNSLVGSAFHLSQGSLLADEELQRRVNAFDWDLEFSAIAEGQGFDIVVGNPPWLMAGYYVADSVPYFKDQFKTATGKFDLYYVFLEQAFRLLAPDGVLGMIVPNKFFHTGAAKALRQLLSQDVSLREVKDFGLEKVFEKATNYSCIILAGRGDPGRDVDYREVTADLETIESYSVAMSRFASKPWHFQDESAIAVFERMREVGAPLENFVDRFATGVQSGSDKILTFTATEAGELGLEHELLRSILRGRDVRAYAINDEPKLLLFPYVEKDRDFHLIPEPQLRRYPVAYGFLKMHYERLAERVWFGKNATELSGAWYGAMYLERASSFSKPHLLTPSLSRVANFAPGNGSLFATGTAGVTGVIPKSGLSTSYLLGLLNSTLLSVYVSKHSPIYQGGFRKYSAPYLRELPIKIDQSGSDPTAASRERRIAELAEIAASSTALAGSATAPASRELQRRRTRAARREIDDLVLEHYGLSAKSRTWVSKQWSRLTGGPTAEGRE